MFFFIEEESAVPPLSECMVFSADVATRLYLDTDINKQVYLQQCKESD